MSIKSAGQIRTARRPRTVKYKLREFTLNEIKALYFATHAMALSPAEFDSATRALFVRIADEFAVLIPRLDFLEHSREKFSKGALS